MFLIVGLGNPGTAYEGTRHNIGRAIAAALAARGEITLKQEKRLMAEAGQGRLGKAKVAVLLPNTFMNASGKAVAAAARAYKVKPKSIIVIHDDADIPLGRGKMAFARSSAGHKGVESVMRALKTKEFWRFRIGIAGRRDLAAEKLVLKKFTPEEIKIMKTVMKRTLAALEMFMSEGAEKAMTQFNRG